MKTFAKRWAGLPRQWGLALLGGGILMASVVAVSAGPILPFSFMPGTVIKADEINQSLQTLSDAIPDITERSFRPGAHFGNGGSYPDNMYRVWGNDIGGYTTRTVSFVKKKAGSRIRFEYQEPLYFFSNSTNAHFGVLVDDTTPLNTAIVSISGSTVNAQLVDQFIGGNSGAPFKFNYRLEGYLTTNPRSGPLAQLPAGSHNVTVIQGAPGGFATGESVVGQHGLAPIIRITEI